MAKENEISERSGGASSEALVPLCFAIPLRSKAASKNWSRVEAQLSVTLASVLAQNDPRFMVFIACHEVPDIPELRDSRVAVLRANTSPPRNSEQMMLDKKHKRKMMAVEFRRRGGGYFMLTDSDDLVSNRVAAFVHETNDPNGYIVKAGWVYDASKRTIASHKELHRYCGTCAIFRFEPDDLPSSMDDHTHRRHDDYEKHVDFERVAARAGRPLRPIPFPSAMYMIGHGENWSTENQRRSIYSKVGRAIKRFASRLTVHHSTPGLLVRQEFNLW